MTTLAHGKRDLIRTMVLATCVALLAGAMIQRDAEANQSGRPVYASVIQSLLCQAYGGTPVVTVGRYGDGVDWTAVTCVGGSLDGWSCQNDDLGSDCIWSVRPNEAANVIPVGGIEDTPDEPLAPPATADERADDAASAEVPAMDEPAVTHEVVAPIAPAEDPATDHTVPTDDTTAPSAPAEVPTVDEPATADDVVAPSGPAEDPIPVEPATTDDVVAPTGPTEDATQNDA